MKKATHKISDDDMRAEYDFSKLNGAVRGKYAKRYAQGTNLILLSPDVAPYFPNAEAVNSALRSLVGIAKLELTHTR